jgi:hypothetical protein
MIPQSYSSWNPPQMINCHRLDLYIVTGVFRVINAGPHLKNHFQQLQLCVYVRTYLAQKE